MPEQTLIPGIAGRETRTTMRKLGGIRGTLICQATGLGKTKTASAFIRRWLGWRDWDKGLRPYQREDVETAWTQLTGGAADGVDHGRVLWVVTGDELIGQAQNELRRALDDEWVSREQADSRADGSRVVVGSVPTMKGDRLAGWPEDTFSLVVIDEAHHAPSNSYRALVNHFACAKRLGLSATPKRHDKKAQRLVFDDWVRPTRPIAWGIDNGYLVPCVPKAVYVDSVDLGNVDTSKAEGGLNLEQAEEEILKSVAAIAQKTFETVGDRRTLIYTPGVGSAHQVAQCLNRLRPGCARSLDGKTDKGTRRVLLEQHKANEYQFLVVCGLLREGYDDPGLGAVVIARPTKSRGFYIQMAGRVFRTMIRELGDLLDRRSAIAASSKPDGMIVDITGRACKHDLISAVDLDGRYNDKIRKRAKELLEEAPGKTLDEIMADAERKQNAEESAERIRLAKIAAEAEVRARTETFNPFSAYGISDPVAQGLAPAWSNDPPDDWQVDWLRSNRLPTKISKAQAQKLYRTSKVRERLKLADFATMGALIKWGIPKEKVKNLSAAKAKGLLAEVAKFRGPPPPERIRLFVGSAA